jgi:hypothetical protein
MIINYQNQKHLYQLAVYEAFHNLLIWFNQLIV